MPGIIPPVFHILSIQYKIWKQMKNTVTFHSVGSNKIQEEQINESDRNRKKN